MISMLLVYIDFGIVPSPDSIVHSYTNAPSQSILKDQTQPQPIPSMLMRRRTPKYASLRTMT